MKDNKFKFSLILLSGIISVILVNCKSANTPQLGKDSIKDVIAAMTLEEKAYFVTGTGWKLEGLDQDTVPVPGAPVKGNVQNIVPGAAGTTYEIPRLGIPTMVLTDGPAGVRIQPTRKNDNGTYYCTAFPIGTLLASTWDTTLVEQVGRAMGNEVLEYGADILLAPAINIHRNPLCGRNFEYYSEDPFVAGNIAAAMINGVQAQGVGTSLKHFAANNAETNRRGLNTIVSERAMREIYLEGFRIAVHKSQPWTVMSSYNLLNGAYTSEREDLLTSVLRNDWGFKGLVMSDWLGGQDPVAQMKAGNDLIMPGDQKHAKSIINAVKEGKLDESILDRNVERILNVILLSPRFKGYKYSNKPSLNDNAVVTRQAATEGMVLMKNVNNALPFNSNTKNLAVFGNTSYNIISGGTGSGDVNEAYSVSLVDGLQNSDYVLDKELQSKYKIYVDKAKEKLPEMGILGTQEAISEMMISSQLANKMAAQTDVALITIGRNNGEGKDRVENYDFNLRNDEKEMIKSVTTAFHAKGKKVIVILNIAGVIEVASWRDMPDAILCAWQAGQETGNSIADILSGKSNPSGKLTSTFPVKYADVPSAKTFPGVITETLKPEDAASKPTGGLQEFLHPKASKIVYEDGIYVGYRYYETFDVKPAYEFGFGLSYTTFEYSNLKLSSDKFTDKITVSVDIKNSGKVVGKEIAELYISAPANKLDKPAFELKGFAKTKLLLPSEIQTLSFEINPHEISSFDPASSSWIAEAGKYTVRIGSSSKDIRQTTTFELPNELLVKKESSVLSASEQFSELKPNK